MYAKLENDNLTFAPDFLTVGNTHVWNAPVSVYLEQGWYPVIYTEEPTVDDAHYAESSWTQEQDSIVQTWTVYEKSDDDEIEYDEVGRIMTGGEHG